jgi:acyl dehydratase
MISLEKKFADINIGDNSSFVFHLNKHMVDDFGHLSGDLNPLHMDDLYAGNTAFGKRVAHGMLGGMLISRLIGMYLPGKYALYLKQTLIFKKPLFIDMDLTVEGTVVNKTDATRTLEINTNIKNNSEVLIEGTALVLVTQ